MSALTAAPKPQRRLQPARALVYTALLPHLVQAARDCGYALAVHGSMMTDLDLVAAPWLEEAVPAEELIEALRVAVDGHVWSPPGWEKNPAYRPHGRRAWSIYLQPEPGPYLDVSVMPRLQDLPLVTLAEPEG